MSGPLEDIDKLWMARRKPALVIGTLQGKKTVAEASRSFDPCPSKIGEWVDGARRGVENALRANPPDYRKRRSGRTCSPPF